MASQVQRVAASHKLEIGPKMTTRTLEDFLTVPATETYVPGERLSYRERQIVQLIQQAKSNKEIAYELCLTVGTVKEYLYHIFRKIGVGNRTELALWGRDYLSEIAS